MTHEDLLKLLNDIQTLTSLDLHKSFSPGESPLSPGEIKAITKALETNTTLTNLNLNSNNLGPEGAKAIAEVLEKNKTLTSLNFAGNNLGVEGAKAIANALITNRSLINLDLRSNNLGVEGAKAIVEALKTNTTLISLDVGYNLLGPEEVKAIANALITNKTLRSLSLAANLLGPEEAEAIAKALEKNITLTSLSLAGNNLGPEGVKAIAKALEKNKTLTSLDLGDNHLGPEEAKAIANALITNKTLRSLILSDNHMGSKGAKAIAKALEKNKTLTKLNLGDIDAEGSKAISKALQVNTTITDIDGIINDQYKNEINDLLQRNRLLAKLKKDFKVSEVQAPLVFSDYKTTDKLPSELEKMEYSKLLAGLKYFSEYFEFSNDEIIDPVWFPTNPKENIKKRIYHESFMKSIFDQTKKDLIRLNELKPMPFLSPATQYELNNLEGNLKTIGEPIEQRFLTPGEARCPITRHTIKETEMKPHEQFRLFRNIFIVAAYNAIHQDKDEYNEKNILEKPETIHIIETWNKLSPEEKAQATANLAEIRKNGISLKDKEGNPLLSEEQIKYLNKWGIGEKSSPKSELKL